MKTRSFHIKNFIALLFAGIINAFGVVIFLMPVRLFDSGLSGVSMFIGQLIGTNAFYALFVLVFNIPFFLYGLKKQGAVFTVYSIFTVIIFSLTAFLIREVFPIDVNAISPIAGSDLFLCSVFGGLIAGVGCGMAVRFGGAIDGIEVMAVITSKKSPISVGTFVMIFNASLYVVAGIVLQSWQLPLYSIIAYVVATRIMDFVVEGIDRAKAAMIVTSKPDAISKRLSDEFGYGITHIKASGYYSSEERTIVFFVVNRFQINRLKTIVREEDATAFITISEVSDVLGSSIKKSMI